jgi:hypothetical protein
MTYTREQLEKMGDAEVDKELAQKLGFKVEQHSIVNIGLQWCIVDEDGSLCRIKKYCSNWNDIMPLYMEYGIDLHKLRADKQLYTAETTRGYHQHITCESPQRAIACCLLMLDLGAKARGEV